VDYQRLTMYLAIFYWRRNTILVLMIVSFSAGKWRFVHALPLSEKDIGKTLCKIWSLRAWAFHGLSCWWVLEKFFKAKRRGKTMLTTRKTKGYHIDWGLGAIGWKQKWMERPAFWDWPTCFTYFARAQFVFRLSHLHLIIYISGFMGDDLTTSALQIRIVSYGFKR
jgi:hypothetical protein